MATAMSAEQRFWGKVVKTDDCWLWSAGATGGGYGAFWDGKRQVRAHRFSYELARGPIPEGLDLDHRHTCPKLCVRPDHLRPATEKQNLENLSGARSDSQTGIRGVTYHKVTKTWCARVTHNQKMHVLGYFKTPEEAGEVARAFRNLVFTHNDADRI